MGLDENNLQARDGGGTRSFRSVLLGWTDPESGDRLAVDMRGPDPFLSQLETLGFQVLGSSESSEATPPEADGSLTFRARLVARRRLAE